MPLSWSRIGASALLQVATALDLLLVEEWTSGEAGVRRPAFYAARHELTWLGRDDGRLVADVS